MRIARGFASCLLGLSSAVQAIDWNLSGKVVDAEIGNGLKNVEVRLAVAGLTATTAKNGTWAIGAGTGVHPRNVRAAMAQNALRTVDGRLRLSIDGADLLGRRVPDSWGTLPAALAARAEGVVADTLIYTKENYVTKRVPISSSALQGMFDSIRPVRYDGWVDSSHANLKADTLNGFLRGPRTITLRWSKQSWDRMMQVMTDSCGAFGTQGAGWGGGTSKACGAGENDYIEKTAQIWVPADIEADGQVWKNVGIRLKGNYSLQTAWTTKNYSLPFRFNTDKFEDSLPETKNQRFYGFQKVSLFPGLQDSSGVRGPVASSIYRQFGVAAPLSVPVHVILKFGDTTKDAGAYEMVEVPDEPFLTRNYGNDSGNLYKPLSKLDQYVASEWEDEDIPGDRADAKALIAVINATNRTSDSAAWHRNLEAAIDVDGFLKWLAASMAIMNWDSYGNLAHNYYLFNDKGRFRWITYDFGWSFEYVQGRGSRTSIWYDESGGFMMQGSYPLIKNLLADKGYCETYRTYVTQALAGPASIPNFQALVDKYADWISSVPSTKRPLTVLRDFMTGRTKEVETSLGNKTCPIK